MSSGSDRRSIGNGNAAEYWWLSLWADAWQTPAAGFWRQAMATQSDFVLGWWKAFGGGVPGALGYSLRGVRLGDLRQQVVAWPASRPRVSADCLGPADLRSALGLIGVSGIGMPVTPSGGSVVAAGATESTAVHRDQHAGAQVPAGGGKRTPAGQAAEPVVRKTASGKAVRGTPRIKRPGAR